MTSEDNSKISSLERMLGILDLFTESAPVWSVEEVGKALAYSRSTAYRYIKELADAGLLCPAESGLYALGPRILQFDRQLRVSDPMLKALKNVAPTLPACSKQQAWLLCRLFNQKVICIDQIGEISAGLSYSRGFPMPLFRGATSKAILAFLPERQQMRVFLENQQIVMDSPLSGTWNEFKNSMRKIRQQGFALSVAEVDSEVFGIAAPVLSPEDKVIGSISLVRPMTEYREDKVEAEGLLLAQIGRNIEQQMSSILGRHSAVTQ